MTEQNPKKTSSNQRALLMKTFSFATEFGFIIALPLIVFGYIGKYLDKRFGTKYIVLIAVLLAITASTLWISRRLKDILKDLQNHND